LYRFQKINITIKKDPYPLPFINEMLNIITRYEAYSLLNGYSRYHQISITLEDKYKISFVTDWGFYMEGDVIWNEKWTFNILESCYVVILALGS
jgi:hypothetical protein